MLKIKDYKTYWEKYIDILPELDGVTLVASEGELTKRMSKLREKKLILAVVLPSADLQGMNVDAGKLNYEGIVFVLTPATLTTATEDSFIDNLDNVSDAVQLLLDTLHEDITGNNCSIVRELDFASIKIDPEINFIGCNGYSLGFNFKFSF